MHTKKKRQTFTKMEKRNSTAPSSPKSSKKAKLLESLSGVVDEEHDDLGSGDDDPKTDDDEIDSRYLTKECVESYLRQNQMCAELALKHYNKKNHTKYELVEALSSSCFDACWMHCNFKAKPATEDGEDSSTTKLFFAEIFCSSPDAVTRCCILKGKTTGCSLCRHKQIEHPRSGCYLRDNRRIYALRRRRSFSRRKLSQR